MTEKEARRENKKSATKRHKLQGHESEYVLAILHEDSRIHVAWS